MKKAYTLEIIYKLKLKTCCSFDIIIWLYNGIQSHFNNYKKDMDFGYGKMSSLLQIYT